MKKNLIIALTTLAGVIALQLGAATPGTEKSIKGEGACAKCLLKETGATDCQLTVTAEEAGKKVTYYVVKNDVAKKFGNPVCAKRQQIEMVGEVKQVGDKHELTASKIELVKESAAPAAN